MKNSKPGAQRILVDEEEPAIREICKRVLVGEDLEVDVAVNGELAKKMLGGNKLCPDSG